MASVTCQGVFNTEIYDITLYPWKVYRETINSKVIQKKRLGDFMVILRFHGHSWRHVDHQQWSSCKRDKSR